MALFDFFGEFSDRQLPASYLEMFRKDPNFSTLEVSKCRIKHVSRDRDFGVIEAIVTISFVPREAKNSVACDYFARTTVTNDRDPSYRARLVANAIMVCLHDMSKSTQQIAA